MPESPLVALCYVSSSVTRMTDDEIGALLRASRDRNATNQVTGLLLYCDGNFMQYIEGPSQGIEPIWESIQRDPRHRGVMLLFHEVVPERLFEGWSMAYTATQPCELAQLMQRVEDQQYPPAVSERARLIGTLLQNFWKLSWSRGWDAGLRHESG